MNATETAIVIAAAVVAAVTLARLAWLWRGPTEQATLADAVVWAAAALGSTDSAELEVHGRLGGEAFTVRVRKDSALDLD